MYISLFSCSGQDKSVLEALETMKLLYRTTKRLVEDEPWGLTILPGSGINPGSVGLILDSLLPLGLQEIHLSGAGWVEGSMLYRRENMGMGGGGEGEWGVWTTDEQKVREVREIADARWDSYVISVERSGSDQ
jgi:copper homeostasis protein